VEINDILYIIYRASIRVSCTSNVSNVGADVFKRRKVKNNKYTYTHTLFVYNKLYTPDGKIMVVCKGWGGGGTLIILINYETTSGDRSGGNNVISRQL